MSFPGCSSTDEYSPCSFSSWMEIHSSILRDTSFHLPAASSIRSAVKTQCLGEAATCTRPHAPVSQGLGFGLQSVQLPRRIPVSCAAVTPHLYGERPVAYELQKLIRHVHDVVLKKKLTSCFSAAYWRNLNQQQCLFILPCSGQTGQ